MNDTQYNGWTNWETWNCKLWIDNEEWSSMYWRDVASGAWANTDDDDTIVERSEEARKSLAERLEGEHYDAVEMPIGFLRDCVTQALNVVNWDEIADSMLGDCDDAEDYGSGVKAA